MCSALYTGGAERQWSILLPGLAARGFGVRVLTLSDRGRFFEEIEAAGIPCSCAGLRSRWDVRGIRHALELAAPAPDMVVTQETNAQVLGQIIATRAKAVHVTVEHRPPGLARGFHRDLLARVVARRVHHSVAVSRSQLPELAALGFDPGRLQVIYNGLPRPQPTTSRASMRASLGIKDREFVALMLAALRAQKRVPVFIDAIAAAYQQDGRIRGLVAGGGPDLGAFRMSAAARGSNVTFLGERGDVANLIEACDVVCLTSWTEATPFALIEAMALERPVLATSVGGVSELVVDGQTGVLVHPPGPVQFSRALQELASDRSHANTLGKAGFRRYKRLFTSEKMIDRYAELFRGIVSRNSASKT